MLPIEHRAYHLYREDAYYEYCMWTDKTASYGPPSFIYLSFQAFKDACVKYGLSLSSQSIHDERMNSPWRRERRAIPESVKPLGLIFRIGINQDADNVQEALREGRNVLALVPDASHAFPWPGQGEPTPEEFKSAGSMLGVSSEDWQMTGKSYWDSETLVYWEEIETDTPGRLFVTRDAFLSDGFFLEGYGFSSENQKQIQFLIEAFACFKTNLIRLSYRNVTQSWPTGEPLTIIVDVVNHGPNCGEVTLRMEIGPEFEAISPLERKIRSLQSLERTSFALQLVPRVDGSFPMVTGASASLENGSSCTVHSNQLALKVRPALDSSQRSSAPQDNETLSRLIEVFQVFHDANMRAEVEALPELARIDARSCLNRIRTVTERIVFNYIDSHRINCRERTLDAAIRALRNNSPFSNRTIGYLHTIRVIGNLGSHATDDPLTDVDVRILSYALASVVEDFMEQNGLCNST